MKDRKNDILLYGADRCHKTVFYLELLESKNLEYTFLDVEKNLNAAQELRAMYSSGKLNFPTLVIHGKKLRNPSVKDINKWLDKKEIKSC